MMRPLIAVTLALACCLTTQCHAGILRIDILDGTVNAGGTGYLNVLISSADIDPVNVDVVNAVNVDVVSYEFIINGLGGPIGTLQFDAQTVDLGNPDYLMFENSYENSARLSNSGSLIGGDLTKNEIGVELNSPKLLVRLELIHTLANGQSAIDADGEQFTISLVSGPDTLFWSKRDSNNQVTEHSFTSNDDGTVKVTYQPQVVPEPVSSLVFACGFVTLIAARKSRRKGVRPEWPLF